MTNWRDIKSQMRRDVHATMRVPAYYRAAPADAWLPIEVRVHSKMTMVGDTANGLGVEGAGHHDITPRLIFWREQVQVPARGAIVSISATEAWQIADSEKPDGLTITAAATPVPQAKIDSDDYPVRDDG